MRAASLGRLVRRIAGAVLPLGVVLFAPARAQAASCGDYVVFKPAGKPQHVAPDAPAPREGPSPCHGPQCSGGPAGLPLAPVRSAPSDTSEGGLIAARPVCALGANAFPAGLQAVLRSADGGRAGR